MGSGMSFVRTVSLFEIDWPRVSIGKTVSLFEIDWPRVSIGKRGGNVFRNQN